jgi:two-component system, LytTR family, sensor kinase
MPESYVIANLIGFTAGLVITALLLVLAMRAIGLPGAAFANLSFAGCALLWNIGGLSKSLLFLLGAVKGSEGALIAGAIQFTGAALWPIPTLVIWRSLADRRWQEIACKALLMLATFNGVAIIGALWFVASVGSGRFPMETLAGFAAYNGSILLVLVAIVLFHRTFASRGLRFYSVATALGVFATTILIILGKIASGGAARAALKALSEQSVLLIVIGAFFLFTRFRFADLFLRLSLRILLATGLGTALILLIRAPFIARLESISAYPNAAGFFVSSLLTTGLLLAFYLLDRGVERLVNQWIFRVPDYRTSIKLLIQSIRNLYAESEIATAAEKIARRTLDLDDVHVLSCDTLPQSQWPPEIREGEVTELRSADPLRPLLPHPNVSCLVPVRVGSDVAFVLCVSLGAGRRSLVTHEVSYLRSAALHLGNRLDLLRTEREMLERETRETLLRQQLTDAELRALRSQVNPHFLFNSLNTIADLIITNPERAELMTVRLAKTFRHVLAQSSRPFTSVQEEIEFVRTYLYIEEARFSDRLQVQIDVAPEVTTEQIPSLILQPIVENALKHGLAPKLGIGHLWIAAHCIGNQICLQVEDDGVGPASSAFSKPNGSHWPLGTFSAEAEKSGVGLANIAQRLRTLYRDGASVSFESREVGGSRVTLLLPKRAGAAAV